MGNDQGEPDVLYELRGSLLGIEINDVYDANSDARQDWTLAAGERAFPTSGVDPREAGELLGPGANLRSRVHRQLQEKLPRLPVLIM